MKRLPAALCTLTLLWTSTALAQHEQHRQHEQHKQQSHSHQHPPGPADKTHADPSQSEREHIAPDPPQHQMHDMPYKAMADMMGMDDTKRFLRTVVDELDWRDGDGDNAIAWDAYARYGGDYNKVWLKTEGERSDGAIEHASVELLWDRVFSRWWSVQSGARHDFGEGPSRNWLGVGVQGLAPYFFEVEATAYVGDGGRTAARLRVEYELLFTQRLILQPAIELNAYGKDDPANRIGSGVSDLEASLRLRYEFRREFAPYIGAAWVRHLGRTAGLMRAAGDESSDLQLLAGIRFWF